MQSLRLVKLMQVLRVEELSEVQRFLCSPFFNTNERCTRLFQELCKFYPAFDSPKLTKERAFAKVFDKAPYDDGKMRKTMTYLGQLIERYLSIKALDEMEDVRVQVLVKSLRDRTDYSLFREVAERRLEKLENQPLRGKDYFREKYLLNELLHFHPETNKQNLDKDYLGCMVEGLEKFFILQSLQNEPEIAIRRRLVKSELRAWLLDASLEIAEKAGFLEEDGIRFFYLLAQLRQGRIEEDLGSLRESIAAALKKLSKYEQSLSINSLRNYAIAKFNAGSFDHARLILELYQYEMQNGLLVMEDQVLSAATYLNIVNTALVVSEIEWAEKFMQEYIQFIPEDDREIVMNLSLGSICFEKGVRAGKLDDFYDALSYFNLVPNRAGYKYDVRVRPAIVRTYFEIFVLKKGNSEELLQQIRNFERHLSYSGLYSDSVKEQYFNFLRYCKTLVRLYERAKIKKDSILIMLTKIESEEKLLFNRWLLSKAKELLNRE